MSLSVGLVILLLIAIHAFYVLAEFGAVGVRRSRIRQLAEEGHALARRLLPHLEDPRRLDRYIAACQVGITLSSLVLGAYGQATLARALAPLLATYGGWSEALALSAASVVVLVGLTSLEVLLSELIPKTVALQSPTTVALATAIPMRWSLGLFSWFIALLNGSGLWLLRLLRIPQARHRHVHSPEEIALLLAESRDGGLLEPDEHRRLQRALQLTTRKVRQLMVPRTQMVAVDLDDPVEEVLRTVAASPFTRLPVYRGTIDDIVGIVHARDLTVGWVRAMRAAGGQRVVPPDLVRQAMRPVPRVPEMVRADRLLGLLREARSQMAIVIDELGGVAGLVTLEDVLRELLGPVPDEFKAEAAAPQRLPDGRLLLPGRMRLHEAEPWIGPLGDGEADTVGGRVVEALGHLPEVGERVTIDGVEVEVVAVEHHAVAAVAVRPAQLAGGRR